MDAYVDMYNSLPTLGDADDRFFQRDVVFEKLAPLLSNYNNQFGVCLIHSHCELKEGEKMVQRGNICQPEESNTDPHYPIRWLDNGIPYEFTTETTPSPPAQLIADFKSIVGDIGVLGLYFAGMSAGIELERTEGRKNITMVVPDIAPGNVETAWLPGTKDPVQMACIIVCEATPTRRAQAHTGQKNHHDVPR
ncbi:hypothetical protein GALMADRAFT_150186 [Galerina marginata CBS 339.88]|uniref:Uncharacterized protein n=1 Tax=Galerina marginata (strain CBS 339.88) TaxID=685588 RepID=A0A067U0G8_GALM3|nr:hypothetical protein GALMADRAFT_150186 [Galerina marginata CBS 339.88]